MEDSDRQGYGGGVINLYASETLKISGRLISNGGDSLKHEYTMLGAGAGGSIKLTGKNIIFLKPPNKPFPSDEEENDSEKVKPYLAVQGGKPEADVGINS